MEITQSRSSLSSSCLTLHTTTSLWVCVCVFATVCAWSNMLLSPHSSTIITTHLLTPDLAANQISQSCWPMRAHINEPGSMVQHYLTIIPPSQGLQITRLIQGFICKYVIAAICRTSRGPYQVGQTWKGLSCSAHLYFLNCIRYVQSKGDWLWQVGFPTLVFKIGLKFTSR